MSIFIVVALWCSDALAQFDDSVALNFTFAGDKVQCTTCANNATTYFDTYHCFRDYVTFFENPIPEGFGFQVRVLRRALCLIRS